MTDKLKLVIASNNKGKLEELKTMLEPLGYQLFSADEVGAPEVDETEHTFEGNSRLKAVETMKHTGLACLADDSGLCVHCLDNRPGVYTARYNDAKTKGYPQAFAKLNAEMGEASDRSAHFECCLAIAFPNGHVETVMGQVRGTIVYPAQGEKGFGYDPMFVPDGYDKTFAELPAEVKNKISHRARALLLMKDILSNLQPADRMSMQQVPNFPRIEGNSR